jgi:hypothetical protein
MSDIVERLRAYVAGESAGTWQGDWFNEAATAIEARDAEIARLRSALEEIEGCQSHNPDNLFRIAYDALKVSP